VGRRATARSDAAGKTLASIAEVLHAVATIPPQARRGAPRACACAACTERHLVECLIGTLKYARRYLAFVHFACTFLGLRSTRQQNLNRSADGIYMVCNIKHVGFIGASV
jgi:hypothetical protein